MNPLYSFGILFLCWFSSPVETSEFVSSDSPLDEIVTSSHDQEFFFRDYDDYLLSQQYHPQHYNPANIHEGKIHQHHRSLENHEHVHHSSLQLYDQYAGYRHFEMPPNDLNQVNQNEEEQIQICRSEGRHTRIFAGIETIWINPPSSAEPISTPKNQSLLFLFHSCDHSPSDWFSLAEESKIVASALVEGFVVIAFSAQDPTGRKCFSTEWIPPPKLTSSSASRRLFSSKEYDSESLKKNHELVPLLNAIDEFTAFCGYDLHTEPETEKESKTQRVKIYGLGVGAGGRILSVLVHHFRFDAISIYMSPGTPRAFDPPTTTPIGWVYMPRDIITSNRSISARINSLRPRSVPTRVWQVYPQRFTSLWLYQQMSFGKYRSSPQLSLELSRQIFYMLKTNRFFDFLNRLADDPRSSHILPFLKSKFFEVPKPVVWPVSLKPIPEPPFKDPTIEEADPTIVITDYSQLPKIFEAEFGRVLPSIVEELNVAYASHEVTAQYVDQVLDWFQAF